MALKARGVKIGLVTSGLYEKAWPEIVAAFRALGMGDPRDFYDAIITAGFPLRQGEAGTLGELSPKPHPWLYAEAARVGLGIPFEARNSVRRDRGQRRGGLRHPAGRLPDPGHGGRKHHRERDAGTVPVLL